MSEELVVQTPESERDDGMAISHDGTTAMLARAEARGKRNNLLMKEASMYAGSSIIPSGYQNKPADCFIAVDMAERMGMSPIFIMQNMYVVKGKPSWSGQACISLINNCGKYTDLEMVFVGKQGADDWGCYCQATHKDTGEVKKGATITIKMAKDEGWASNSKWKNMPEQMLQYRAAAFFARTRCPEALMGLSVADEAEHHMRTESTAASLTEALNEEIGEAPVFNFPPERESNIDPDAAEQTAL